jgi:hypothetical protein
MRKVKNIQLIISRCPIPAEPTNSRVRHSMNGQDLPKIMIKSPFPGGGASRDLSTANSSMMFFYPDDLDGSRVAFRVTRDVMTVPLLSCTAPLFFIWTESP